jgi:hypothetical protein
MLPLQAGRPCIGILPPTRHLPLNVGELAEVPIEGGHRLPLGHRAGRQPGIGKIDTGAGEPLYGVLDHVAHRHHDTGRLQQRRQVLRDDRPRATVDGVEHPSNLRQGQHLQSQGDLALCCPLE